MNTSNNNNPLFFSKEVYFSPNTPNIFLPAGEAGEMSLTASKKDVLRLSLSGLGDLVLAKGLILALLAKPGFAATNAFVYRIRRTAMQNSF